MKKMVKLSTIVLLCTLFISAESTGYNEALYNGKISGVNGGTIIADELAISFPRGIANVDISISVEKSNSRPNINGTIKQINAYKQFRFIGPIYKINANPKQFNSPYVLTVRFDPAEFDKLREGEIPMIISISDDGILELPEVLLLDPRDGLITVRASHFSYIAFTAAPHFAIVAFATNNGQSSPSKPTQSPNIERIYSSQVSGVNGGTINADSLAITLPRGIGKNNISISIDKGTDIPAIHGSEEQQKAYKQLRFIGPIYKITASQKQFEKSFYLMIRFDPSEFDRLKEGEILHVISISDDGIATFPKVVNSDFRKGVMTIESSHFSWISIIATNPYAVAVLGVVAVSVPVSLGYIANARLNPWQFIQPDDDSIDNIAHQLSLPTNRNNDVGFTMEGFNKRFVGMRDPMLNKRPYSGTETLNQDNVLCWDLVNLYGSLLANMAQRPDKTGIHGEAIRFVTGKAGDVDHTWIEIVIDGKAYVVDTVSLKEPFRFIPIEKAYKGSNLRPLRMHTLTPSSLTDYDAKWYSTLLDQPLSAEEIRTLEDRAAQLFIEHLQLPDTPQSEMRKKEIENEMNKIKQKLHR